MKPSSTVVFTVLLVATCVIGLGLIRLGANNVVAGVVGVVCIVGAFLLTRRYSIWYRANRLSGSANEASAKPLIGVVGIILLCIVGFPVIHQFERLSFPGEWRKPLWMNSDQYRREINKDKGLFDPRDFPNGRMVPSTEQPGRFIWVPDENPVEHKQ